MSVQKSVGHAAGESLLNYISQASGTLLGSHAGKCVMAGRRKDSYPKDSRLKNTLSRRYPSPKNSSAEGAPEGGRQA